MDTDINKLFYLTTCYTIFCWDYVSLPLAGRASFFQLSQLLDCVHCMCHLSPACHSKELSAGHHQGGDAVSMEVFLKKQLLVLYWESALQMINRNGSRTDLCGAPFLLWIVFVTYSAETQTVVWQIDSPSTINHNGWHICPDVKENQYVNCLYDVQGKWNRSRVLVVHGVALLGNRPQRDVSTTKGPSVNAGSLWIGVQEHPTAQLRSSATWGWHHQALLLSLALVIPAPC